MIKLTRLNESPFYLNSDLIEFIEVTPDTVITMMNGSKVRARESAEEVVGRIVEYRRRVAAAPLVIAPGSLIEDPAA